MGQVPSVSMSTEVSSASVPPGLEVTPTPTAAPWTSARTIPVASMPAASMREDPTGVSVLKASKATQTSNVEVRKPIYPYVKYSHYNV